MLGRFRQQSPISKQASGCVARLERKYTKDGIFFREAGRVDDEWLVTPERFGNERETVDFLNQVLEEGYGVPISTGVQISWPLAYQLLAAEEYAGCSSLLGMPEQRDLRPVLTNGGSLSDRDFSITLTGWKTADGVPLDSAFTTEGAVLTNGQEQWLLPQPAWEVLQSVGNFYRRPDSERAFDAHLKYWSEIRCAALEAKACLNDFLNRTVVVMPHNLELNLRRSEVTGDKVVEIIPSFDGAPAGWLASFDRFTEVAEHYQIADGEALSHVLVSSEVRAVLTELKRMPGRRVAGERAEAFVRNPFGVLGPEAAQVLDPEQFEQAREEAGLYYARFTAKVFPDDKGRPYDVGLCIEETSNNSVTSHDLFFIDDNELKKFIEKLAGRIGRGASCCPWQGFDLEILGDTFDQLEILKKAYQARTTPAEYTYTEIFDISKYSDRIEGFGIERPYYSPFIKRKDEGAPWFPDNIEAGVVGENGEAILLSEEQLQKLQDEIELAERNGATEINVPGIPRPLPPKEARDIIHAIQSVKTELGNGVEFPPPDPPLNRGPVKRQGLIVKPNIEELDYIQLREALQPVPGTQPKLPKSLRLDVVLRDHQLTGIGWLQHLWGLGPEKCRGAMLADDMGLGKTIQLLAFIAACLEADPTLDPVLIVAPVSLLENWQEEIEKFFTPNAFPLLTLYGDALAAKRAPRSTIGEDLLSNGVIRLLKRDWIADAKLVLTTYETLRDLEFSLAGQRWSMMICDESQKIKTPNAMVTRAAKKQNVQFKIACTGTPVENTLVDLWCLFDFVQPGLLGALNEFGSQYRRPIEAETDEEKQKIEELKVLIAPQILRREKKDVAKDLPQKLEDIQCQSLSMSPLQRQLYGHAVSQFRTAQMAADRRPGTAHLGLLSEIRKICSSPTPIGHDASYFNKFEEAMQHSPKLAWLDTTLSLIREKGEKVIIFTELRDLQRVLKRFIMERFDYTPEIINGDTSTNSKSEASRQKKIRAFQGQQGFGVIILSPLAVGFGVNIQAANHVIHYTRMWNPAKEDQATDRAYRIGQTKNVYVYYPVVVAHDFVTFDAKLHSLLGRKRKLSSDMLNGTGSIEAAEFGDIENIDGSSALGGRLFEVNDILSMQPKTFELYCSVLLEKQGYRVVHRAAGSGDGGIDVCGIKGAEGILMQCKTTSRDSSKLGWEAVKDVVAGEAAFTKKYPRVNFLKIIAANQYFNEGAHRQSQCNDVVVWERPTFEKLVDEYPIKQFEVERLLIGV